MYPLWKRNQVVKRPFPAKIRQETETSLHFSLDATIFSAFELKIINTSVFQELIFALRCSFANDRAIASETRYPNSNKEKRISSSEMLTAGTQC